MHKHLFTPQLFETDPFSFTTENKQLFLKSFQENALFHYEHHLFTQRYWDHEGFHPSQLQAEEDLSRIPPTMIHLYKEHAFCSVPANEIALTLTSSGTGGQKSQQFLSHTSLENVKHLAYQIHASLGMTSEKMYNYLCFTYDPHVAKDLGTAFTDELLTQFTGKQEVTYAFEWDDQKKDFVLDQDKIVATLKRYEASSLPTRILGFPAFLWDLLEGRDLHFNLGPDSWVQTGGGYKGKDQQEIPKDTFRTKVSERLTIPKDHVRDLYGLVEHGIPYVDCEQGQLHIPQYSRVFIRSPHDLSLKSKGESGLIHFLCSYNFSYPAPSLLTTDYGWIEDCPCERGETLHLKGRAGIQKHKGCALKALEKML
jgi:phenylacetate-coenzyme A ligase PaaK-like adenylate-forming protein